MGVHDDCLTWALKQNDLAANSHMSLLLTQLLVILILWMQSCDGLRKPEHAHIHVHRHTDTYLEGSLLMQFVTLLLQFCLARSRYVTLIIMQCARFCATACLLHMDCLGRVSLSLLHHLQNKKKPLSFAHFGPASLEKCTDLSTYDKYN